MRQVREILRLKYEQGLPHRAIARACGVGLGTVSEYCRRAQRAALTWPLPADLDDAQLEARLFRRIGDVVGVPRPLPDMAWIHQELKRPGVTLQRLHLEYLAREPDGYRYSQFCRHYHDWARTLAPTMRQIHRAGEKAFVDFSGKRPVIYDVTTGEVRPVELFVGALGASSYVYAEACPSQDLAAWITAHVRMVEFFGGAPAIFVPDNLRSGVTQACRYEPSLNRTYLEFAQHYGAAVVPARAGHPRDKAVVEANVLVAQRWILAVLRHRRFFSLAELNAAVRELLTPLNARPMRKLGVSRRALFEQLDRPLLRPLPASRYEFAEWRDAGVTSTTTSSSSTTTTASPTSSCINGSRSASPPPRSNCFSKAGASPRIADAGAAASTPPSPPTCRTRIGRTPSGRPRASSAGRRRRAPPPPRSSPRCWRASRIPSRAIARVWASCA